MTRHDPDDWPEPGLDAVRCEHCGAWIVETPYGWGDWNAPSLVFCDLGDVLPTTRHRPPAEPEPAPADGGPRAEPYTASERADLRDAGRGHLIP